MSDEIEFHVSLVKPLRLSRKFSVINNKLMFWGYEFSCSFAYDKMFLFVYYNRLTTAKSWKKRKRRPYLWKRKFYDLSKWKTGLNIYKNYFKLLVIYNDISAMWYCITMRHLRNTNDSRKSWLQRAWNQQHWKRKMNW